MVKVKGYVLSENDRAAVRRVVAKVGDTPLSGAALKSRHRPEVKKYKAVISSCQWTVLFLRKEDNCLHICTKSKHIPTKMRKYEKYFCSTNTVRTTLFPQNISSINFAPS